MQSAEGQMDKSFAQSSIKDLNDIVNSMSVIVVDDKHDDNKGFQTERIAYSKPSDDLTKNVAV